jgi:hypothetical protein
LRKTLAAKKAYRVASGIHVTVDQYRTLRNSYLTNRNVKKAAAESGVSLRTAANLILKGTSQFPAIKTWADQAIQKVVAEDGNQLLEEIRLTKAVQVSLMSKLVKGIKNIKLEPTGTQESDGTIIVNENTFDKAVRTARALSDFSDHIEGRKAPRPALPSHAPQPPTQIGINVTNVQQQQTTTQNTLAVPRPEDVRTAAWDLLLAIKRTVGNGTTEEQAITRALIAETGTRIRTPQEPLDVTPEDNLPDGGRGAGGG